MLNVDAYEALYVLENALRELIVEALTSRAGPSWFRTRVTAATREKAQANLEKSKPFWTLDTALAHGVYFVDLGDLISIIVQRNNWDDAFAQIFSAKTAFEGTIYPAIGVRNEVAHNRPVSLASLAIAKGALSYICLQVGQQKVQALAERLSASTARQLLESARQTIDRTTAMAVHGEAISEDFAVVQALRNEWWAGNLYVDMFSLRTWLRLISEYRAIPRGRGRGQQIVEWQAKNSTTLTSLASTAVKD
jgi:hypothetical protein